MADPASAEKIQLALALVRAVADDCDVHDQRMRQSIKRVEDQLAGLETKTNQHWNATEGYVTALYTALYSPRAKGGTR
jgi:hypothetical protein